MIEHFMQEHGIERIVRRAPTDLLPEEGYHVHLLDGHLAEHIGRGATVDEATHDAIRRVRMREAA